MSKKKWSVDDVADVCSCQTQKVWMWQSITDTVIGCNTWKSRSDVLVKDKLSLVLQHPFTFGWVQSPPPPGHMRNQEWSPDKWFLLLKRGPKPLLSYSSAAKHPVMCLAHWIQGMECAHRNDSALKWFFSLIPATAPVQDLVWWKDGIFPGSELSCWWEAKYLSLNPWQFLNSVIIPRICGIWNTDIW